MRPARLLRWLLYPVLALLLVVAVVAHLVWFTEAGADRVLSILGDRVPDLSFRYEGGTMATGLELSRVRYAIPQLSVEVARLRLRPSFYALFGLQAGFEELTAQSVDVHWEPAAASGAPPRRVDIALPILFQDIRLRDVAFRYGETARRQFDAVEGRLRLHGELLKLNDISVVHAFGKVEGEFQMGLNAPYAMRGGFSLDAPVARARGTFSGDSDRIVFDGATAAPRSASFVIELNPGRSPLFSVDARSERLAVASDVVLNRATLFATGDAEAYRYRVSASVSNPLTPNPVEATAAGSGSTDGIQLDSVEGTSSALSFHGSGRYGFSAGRLQAELTARWESREVAANVELREAFSDAPTGTATLDFAGNVLKLDMSGGSIEGSLDAANLSAAYPGAAGRIDGTVRVEPGASAVNASLRGTALGMEQQALGDAQVDYQGNFDGGDVTLDWRHPQFGLELLAGVNRVSGSGGFATVRRAIVTVAERRWQLSDPFAIRSVGEAVRLDDHCWSDGDGRICVGGARLDAWSVALEVAVNDVTTAMLTTRELVAQLEFDRRREGRFEGRVSADRIAVGEPGTVLENVRVEAGGSAADYKYEASALTEVAGRSLGLTVGGTGSPGGLDLEHVTVESGEDELAFAGRYTFDRGLLQGDIRGAVRGHAVVGRVSLEGAGVETLKGEGRITVAGNELVASADGHGLLNFVMSATNLAGLREGIEGQLTATADWQVATRRYRVTASATGLKAGGHELGRLEVNAEGTDRELAATASAADWRYDAWDLGGVTMDYNGPPSAATLSVAWRNPWFEAELSSTVDLRGGRLAGNLTRGRVVVGSDEWRLAQETAFALSGGSATVADHCWEYEPSSVCIRSAGYADRMGAFTALLVEMPVDLAEMRFAPEVTVKGALNVGVHGEVDARGDSPTYSGTVAVNMPGTRIGYFDDRERVLDLTADIALEAGKLKGVMDVVGDEGERLNVEVTIPEIDKPRELTARAGLATGDLGIVTAFVPQLDQARGTLTSNVEIDTTRGNQLARVAVDVTDDASVVIPAAGIALKNMRMTARTDGEDIVFDVGATSGEGRMGLTGSISSPLTTARRLDATIEGERFALLKRHDMSLIASSAITVGYDNDRRLDVGGNIQVVDGNFVLRNGGLQIRRPSDDVVVVSRTAEPTTGNKLYLDLDVEVRKFNMQLAGLNADVEGRVRLTESPASPRRAVGNLRLVGGTFSRYGQSFDIDRGRLIFGGPLDNPSVDIVSTRTIQERTRDVSVSLVLSGPANNISSTLVSNPPMSDARALSYLVLGRPLDGASSADGQSLSAAAFAFGLKRALPITEEIGSALGLSEFTVNTDIDSTNVIAGKRLSPELYVEYNYDVFGRVGGFLFNYQLTDRLSLETHSGETKSMQLIYTFD